jgi:hypothetical protein
MFLLNFFDVKLDKNVKQQRHVEDFHTLITAKWK